MHREAVQNLPTGPAAAAGTLAGMPREATLTWTREFDPRTMATNLVAVLRMPEAEYDRLTARQLHDLHAGLRLLRAAMLPDAFFHGHARAGLDNEGPSVMARIEIVGALEDLQHLPQAAPARG